MDDDGQAIDAGDYFAYEVDTRSQPAGPRITVWTYVCYIGDTAYGVGLRYQYSHDDDPDWVYVGYAADPEGEEFSTNPDADATAADWAGGIANRPGDWQGPASRTSSTGMGCPSPSVPRESPLPWEPGKPLPRPPTCECRRTRAGARVRVTPPATPDHRHHALAR